MIPDSAGATPFGIFLLADEFLDAACRASEERRGHASGGPALLLSYHAAELFLKAHLRSCGFLVTALRAMQHDLAVMITEAAAKGLVLPSRTVKMASLISNRIDYVRVRYMVTKSSGALTEAQAIQFSRDIREAVRAFLNFNEFGQPQGDLWVAGEPSDYLEAGRRDA